MSEPPVGRAGRVIGGNYDQFFVEVDDHTARTGGTGGYYVLWWTLREPGYDDWLRDWPAVLNYWREAPSTATTKRSSGLTRPPPRWFRADTATADRCLRDRAEAFCSRQLVVALTRSLRNHGD